MTKDNKSFVNMMRTGEIFDRQADFDKEWDKRLRKEQITLLVSIHEELNQILEQCQRRWGDVPVNLSLDIDQSGFLNITAERIESDDA